MLNGRIRHIHKYNDLTAWTGCIASPLKPNISAMHWKKLIIKILIIIMSPQIMKRMNEYNWEDLECLYKACQTAITVGGLFADTGINQWADDEWDKGENGNEMRNLSQVKRPGNWQKMCEQTKGEMIGKQRKLWWRSAAILMCKSIVKLGDRGERLIEHFEFGLTRGDGKKRNRIN